MKRSGPPKRTKPLRANTATTRAWLQRSRSPLRRDGTQRPRPRRATNRAYADACRDVDSRSGGWCEANVPGVCPAGRHRAEHHHHIVLRAQGGPDEAWNLLHVCARVHTWAHDENRAEAERLGIIRRRTT